MKRGRIQKHLVFHLPLLIFMTLKGSGSATSKTGSRYKSLSFHVVTFHIENKCYSFIKSLNHCIELDPSVHDGFHLHDFYVPLLPPKATNYLDRSLGPRFQKQSVII